MLYALCIKAFMHALPGEGGVMIMAKTKIIHGRTTVPKAVLESLGLKEGDSISWVRRGGEWMIAGKHYMTESEWEESIERGLEDIKVGRVHEYHSPEDLFGD